MHCEKHLSTVLQLDFECVLCIKEERDQLRESILGTCVSCGKTMPDFCYECQVNYNHVSGDN